MPVPAAEADVLRSRLHALGFDDVRFARIDDRVPGDQGLRAWLAAGYHADMDWMARSADRRLDPEQVLPGARSMILLGVNYWSAMAGGGRDGPRWARYALHDDYHDTIGTALAAAGEALRAQFGVSGTDYRWYVDTGPVLERSWAARAGLGFTGKNAMLISRRFGNWLFLAAIVTRLDLPADRPIHRPPRADPSGVGLLCGKCTRCLDACPTQAFAAPGMVDARKCVSYQTIENRGVIPRELRAGIGSRIYGCDVCLEVCPWNRFAQEGRRVLLRSRDEIAMLTLAEILELTPVRFAEVFRRTAVKRLKLRGLLRNACVVAGNARDRACLPALRMLCGHPEPVVRAHAVWAVYRLGEGASLEALRVAERDPAVLAEYQAEDSAAATEAGKPANA